MPSSSEKIDRVMRLKYHATLAWYSQIGDAVRCYKSETQRFMVESLAGKWAIYTFHEEIEE